MKNASPPLRAVLWKLAKQCFFPAVLALAYAFWDFSNVESSNAPAFLRSFGVAFFLIMWFVGQFLRAAKQIGDADSLRFIHENVANIRTRMAEKDDVISLITQTYADRDGRGQDLLIVVDVQKDFCEGGVLEAYDSESLIEPLNRLIEQAEECGNHVVFTRDWHPANHKSFDIRGGPWRPHCIQGQDGAQFHDQLRLPDDAKIVNIGEDPESHGYSAFEDAQLKRIVTSADVRHIYVAGIALNYCVLATCLEAYKYGKPVIALEPYIRPAKPDDVLNRRLWNELTEHGIIRSDTMGLARKMGHKSSPHHLARDSTTMTARPFNSAEIHRQILIEAGRRRAVCVTAFPLERNGIHLTRDREPR